MLTRVEWLPTIAANIIVTVGWSVLVGATAPRWPDRWLARDRGPLHLNRHEDVRRYRRTRIPAFAERLPELGETFGGASKRTLPERTPESINAYLVEVRRAEWVHWLSCLGVLPLLAWNPWWLWLAFTLVVVTVNSVFIVILRHNRVRLNSLLRRMAP